MKAPSGDYLKLLENSYGMSQKEPFGSRLPGRLEFLSEDIFNFTTYDSAVSELFGARAVEVCAAITEERTFACLDSEENYRWFLILCNMPFFNGRLDWGGSIRGAWWSWEDITFQSCGLYDGEKQMADEITFTGEEWRAFMRAIVEFASQK